MQSAEQLNKQSDRPAHWFKPGESGNASGRESNAAKAARIARKVDEWLAPFGGTGALKPAELDLVRQAADLQTSAPRKGEDTIRRARMIVGLLAAAGVVSRHRRRKPILPTPSLAELLRRP